MVGRSQSLVKNLIEFMRLLHVTVFEACCSFDFPTIWDVSIECKKKKLAVLGRRPVLARRYQKSS